MAGEHPLGRLGQVSDIVDGVLYLERAASSRVRSFTSTADKLREVEAPALLTASRISLYSQSPVDGLVNPLGCGEE